MRAIVLTSVFFAAVLGCGTSANDLFSGAGGGGDTSGKGGAGTGTSTHSGNPSNTGTSTSSNGQGAGSNVGTGTGSGNHSNVSSSVSTSSNQQASVGVGGSDNVGVGVGGSSGTSGQGGGLSSSTSTTSTGAGGGDDGCSADAKLVYVVSLAGEIYSFDPPTKQFIPVAAPNCEPGAELNSMAIDRKLTAWINYIGSIYTFDLKNPQNGCQLAISLPSGFTQIGMGFSTDANGGTAETLYVASIQGRGLGRLDTSSNTIVRIGDYTGGLAGNSAELTGTGDGRLFGYFTTSPNVRVAQIDKTDASILTNVELMGVSPPSDWAFSFWGGDFYLYAAPGNNNSGNSSVIHYSPSTGAVDTSYVADTGFQIVGAGVSTCAPVVINPGGG